MICKRFRNSFGQLLAQNMAAKIPETAPLPKSNKKPSVREGL